MPALPWWLEAAIAAELLYAVLRAFRGAPPRHRDRFAAAMWLGAAVLLVLAGALSDGGRTEREILVAPGVIAACVAGWWMRAGRSGGEDHGDGGGGEPDAPLDWDEFDRLRAGWRPKQTA